MPSASEILSGGTQVTTQTKEPSFIKKVILSVMILAMFPSLVLATDVRMLKNPAVLKNVPATRQDMELKRAAKILSIGFRTEPTGQWLFTYEIQNTGLATLNLRNAQIKTTQILDNGSQVPVHTVNTVMNLGARQTITGCSAWNRCSNASQLKLEMVYENVLLDTMTTSVPPLKVDMTKAVCDQKTGKWRATLKNLTGHDVKVSVRPISADGKAGLEVVKIIAANGTSQCSSIADMKSIKALQVIFRDEKMGGQPGYVVLDTHNLSSGLTIGSMPGPRDKTQVKAFVESITWTRAIKQWVATVRNNTALPLAVGVAGFPLENGQQGMTVWTNETIPADGSVQLVGDYKGFSVPPGTRLKVHVLLKPSNAKISEKIITLD
jgi:hypothetical protein